MTEHLQSGAAEEPPADTPALDEPLLDELPPAPVRRRYPSTIGGVLYLGILAATVIGLAITALDDWRFGMKWVAGALVAAAVLRLVLPRREAGMLEVRHRVLDAFILGGVGITIFVLSTAIPNQPL